eukprot:3473140-Pleurochrysis_carterae.AAC.1
MVTTFAPPRAHLARQRGRRPRVAREDDEGAYIPVARRPVAGRGAWGANGRAIGCAIGRAIGCAIGSAIGRAIGCAIGRAIGCAIGCAI